MNTKLDDQLTILKLALARCHDDEKAALRYLEAHVRRHDKPKPAEAKKAVPKSNRIAAVLKRHGPLTIGDICAADTYMPHMSAIVARSVLEIHGNLFVPLAGGRWGLVGIHEDDDTVTADRLESLRALAYDAIDSSDSRSLTLAEVCSKLEISKKTGEEVLDFSWFTKTGKKYAIATTG